MAIRAASADDFKAIARLHADSWRDAYRGLLPDGFINYEMDGELERYWRDVALSEKDFVLVDESQNGDIAGFILVWGEEMPYIESLHVEPGRRSGGVGERLMRAAAEELQSRGFSTAHLWVMTGNPRARAFYERLGGHVTGEEPRDIFGYKALNYKVEWSDLSMIVNASPEQDKT